MTTILQDLITIFLGITVEAFPFLIIGVCFSVFVELFIKSEWILKIIPKNRFISHPLIALIGVFMPVCECGNVPVARRFLMHKFTVSQTITFLLAAPIINPITFISTLEAFNFDRTIALYRVLAAYIIAVLLGILISFKKNQEDFLTTNMVHEIEMCEHDHLHEGRFEKGLEVFKDEFFTTAKLLMIGALIAAITQTVLPRNIIESVGSSPTLSILAMLILAFIVSICSNIDAFFALAYVNTFTTGSLLTFMVFGPMIDMKILTMLKSTFKTKLLIYITVIVALMSTLTGLLFNYFS